MKKTFKDLEKEVKAEIKAERMEQAKELMKERLIEIEAAERTVKEMKKQYENLLKEII